MTQTPEPQMPSRIESLLLGALIASLLLGVGAAWAIGLVYVPTASDAHASLVYATEYSPWWKLAWGMVQASQTMIAASGLLLLFVRILERSFRAGQRAAWYALLATLSVFAAWSFFGQMLAWDQTAWHGTNVRMGIVESLPLVGPLLADWMRPQGELGQSSLALAGVAFFGVGSTFLLLTTMALIRTRPLLGGVARGVGAILGVVLLVVLAWQVPSLHQLDIAARPQNSLDVRPEWFFLPVSVMIEKTHDGTLRQLAVLAPFAMFVLLILWPYLYGRWMWVFDRLVACIGVLAVLGLAGWKLGEDASASSGYFRELDVEHIMTEVGALNAAFGWDDQEVPPDVAYASVADLVILAHQATAVGRNGSYPKLKDAAKWQQWSEEMRQAALDLWKSPPDRLAQARARFRASCTDCHQAYEVDEELYDGPGPVVFADIAGEPRPDAPNLRFTPERMEVVTASDFAEVSLSKLMKASKREFGVLNAFNQEGAARALVDLTAQYQSMKLKLADDWLAGEEVPAEEQAAWDDSVDAVLAALAAIRAASDERTYRTGLSDLRKACLSCHDIYEEVHENPDTEPPLVRTLSQ